MVTRLHMLFGDSQGICRGQVEERLRRARDQVNVDTVPSLLDGLTRGLLQDAFRDAGATEGSLWWLDPSNQTLRVVFNSGPNASALVERAIQPVGDGLVSMVLATERGSVENDVASNAQHSKTVDQQFGQTTLALLAVPFYFLDACAGVVSCVKLAGPDAEQDTASRFRQEDLVRVERATRAVGKLIEYHVLKICVGLSDA